MRDELIYEMVDHICNCGYEIKCYPVDSAIHRSKNWPLKNSIGFNGIRTHDLLDAGAMLFQLRYEATQLGAG